MDVEADRQRSRLITSLLVTVLGVLAILGPVLTGAAFATFWLVQGLVLLAALVVPALLYVSLKHEPPRWLLSLLLGLCATTFSITLVDLGARLLPPQIFYARPDEKFWIIRPDLPVITGYRPNRVYEGRTYGDLVAATGEVEYREWRDLLFITDDFGYRNTPSEPGAIDLILLGDSFAAGVGTTQAETLAGQLESQYGLSVYNLGLPTHGPSEAYLTLRAEIDRLPIHSETTLIWILFGGNDLDDGRFPGIYQDDALPWADSATIAQMMWQNYISRSPLNRMIHFARSHAEVNARDTRVPIRTLPDGRSMLFAGVYQERTGRDPADLRNHPNYASFVETMDAMTDLAESHNLRAVIVTAPAKSQVYSWLLNDQDAWSTPPTSSGFAMIADGITAERGLCFVDLGPALIAAAPMMYEQSGALLWWTDDSHWNHHGQRVAAETLVEELCLDKAQFCCT